MSFATSKIFAGRYKLLQRTALSNNIETWQAEDIKTYTRVSLRYTAEAGNSVVNAQLLKEFLLLTQIKHHHLLAPLHYDEYEGIAYVVYPDTADNSLIHLLQENKIFSETEAKNLFLSTAKALQALHKENVLHRNIQPSNIFYSSGNYLLGAFKRPNEISLTNQQQLVPFGAPELFSEQPEYTEKSDIFSLAVVVYYCCTGNIPWQGLGGMALLKGALVPKLPNTFTEHFSSILKSCMAADASERPTANNLIDLLSKEYTASSNNYLAEVENIPEKTTDFITPVKKKRKPIPIMAMVIFLVIISVIGFLGISFLKIKNESVSEKPKNNSEMIVTNKSNDIIKTETKKVKVEEVNEVEMVEKDTVLNTPYIDKPWKRKITPYRNEAGKYGFMGYGRRVIIKPVFEDVFAFSEGLAACKFSGLWGYVDSSGTWVIEPQYKTATVFKNGKAKVEKDGMVFSINLNGKCIEGCESITHQSLQ